MAEKIHTVLLSLLAVTFCSPAFGYESSPLQDFRVADPNGSWIYFHVIHYLILCQKDRELPIPDFIGS